MTVKLNENYVLRQVAEEFILIPVTGDLDFNGIIALNEVGKEIYDLLPQVENEEELVDRLYDIFEATKEEIAADCKEFLAQLRTEKILLD